ncbi:MAG: hypothetical protein ACLGG9_06610 [Thermoleophilia bacterium]|jgi:hypothetical protein
MRLEILSGGVPDPARMAALTAAATALMQSGGPAAHPTPPAYRSRWRRAALLEGTEVPSGIKDNGTPWGGTA